MSKIGTIKTPYFGVFYLILGKLLTNNLACG